MIYSIPDCFMAAFAAGLVFALVYEAMRIIRILLPLKVVTFICDVLFFVLAALAVVKLSLALGNYVRGYTVLGFGAGIFTYITTIGRFINRLENVVFDTVKAVISAFFRGIYKFFRKVFGFIAHKLHLLFRRIHKICEKLLKKSGKLLKKRPQMVYNKISHNKDTERSGSGNVIHAKVKRSNSS